MKGFSVKNAQHRHLLYFFSSTKLAVLLITASFVHAEFTHQEIETFANKPSLVKDLLERTVVMESDESNLDASWKVASLYCEVARYGRAEGLYRLDMLYAFGRGVPANQ